MAQYFINSKDFLELVKRTLNGSTVIAPIEFDKKNRLELITSENFGNINLSGFRAVEPFKSYIFRLIEKVSKYFGGDEAPHGKILTIIGARGCDLEALEVLDRVFGEGDLKDPFYLKSRENMFIIGADCTDCGETCFCTTVKGKPFPQKLFDINLSPSFGGFVAEAGTEKGSKFILDSPDLFTEALETHIEEKERNRQRITSLVDEKNRQFHLRVKLSETHKANLTNKVWKTLTKDCVECSACNFICPTCTCFLLLDQDKNKDKYERFKVWDACLKASYAKVAGGANPRGKLHERLQNRYQCKFDYSFDRLDRYTCVGCGRCIDGCAGNIDMRKIFMELEKQAPFTAILLE